MKYIWESEVRDNEVDLQGVVNNANYFVYMAHARHKYIKTLGLDFAKLHNEGFDLLLIHTDIDFKDSLRSGDEFIVTSFLRSNGRIRFDFVQEVIRKNDSKVVVSAINTGVCISTGTRRPVMPDILKSVIEHEEKQGLL
jgi:acyl-CoA thioester hydrolase